MWRSHVRVTGTPGVVNTLLLPGYSPGWRSVLLLQRRRRLPWLRLPLLKRLRLVVLVVLVVLRKQLLARRTKLLGHRRVGIGVRLRRGRADQRGADDVLHRPRHGRTEAAGEATPVEGSAQRLHLWAGRHMAGCTRV